MSSATDFLTEWIGKAAVRAPSITRTTAQRWPDVGTPPHFKPGISSYGWGFSDRGQNLSNPPPNSGDQFQGNKADTEQMTFTIVGDTVQLDAADGPSRQLISVMSPRRVRTPCAPC